MYQAKTRKNMVVTEVDSETALEQTEELRTRQKILIVDDSEMNRAILCEMLGKDYDILEAGNGRGWSEAAAGERHLHFPDASGYRHADYGRI